MGSGSTAVACLGLERLFVGLEIREDYCEIAASRIDDFITQKQLTLAQLSLL